ncbi:MAG: hypothetical protein CFH18_00925 [Alphaproteobacteria bacterium MarineAlpha5_Bin8]|nr:MAG: hypothetical protein CFH18_00925 [Alphaproteobacteria bacterium MarineAlpha5_Bin8]PPR45614.1 MAG: hypothetical protein CFH17_00488 [Alphaproteobacteria bacterium MarineAlpha5_Bin7]PPR53853.1 MAG: hypothetical protein CFH16_00778 [Alphaproteobacteria bacterium MarineAlpha5_Bin6]|tara:strand:+ start:20119 stop:20247 length:129 start_codon:yes stop_codon:yes gene_type:complete
MKKRYLLIILSILVVLGLIGLFSVDIPSPSRLFSESYQLDIQ